MIHDLFNRQYAKKDILAGLTLAVESVPDGMAVGTLAAISPMNGVYAYMLGGLSGAFFTSSVSLSIQATSAMAVIVLAYRKLPSNNQPQKTEGCKKPHLGENGMSCQGESYWILII